MNEGLWVVSVFKIHQGESIGWQTPVIFLESQKKEMDEFIFDKQLQRNSVSTTWIYGMAVEPLRQFFKDEASAKLPEIISFDFTPRNAVEVLFDPPVFPDIKDK